MGLRWAIGTLLLVFTTIANGADQQFCSTLAAVRALATENFASLEGPVRGDSQWDVTKSLPGFASCYLLKFDVQATNYMCESPPTKDEQGAVDQLWKLASKIEACPKNTLQVMGQRQGQNTLLFDSTGGAGVGLIATNTIDIHAQPATIKWVTQLTVLTTVPTAAAAGSDGAKDTGDDPPMKKEFAPAATFCPKLTTVLTAAESAFSSILGKGTDGGGWDTDTKLPSLTHCKISGYPDGRRYYSCQVSDQPDRTSSNADLDSLRDLIKQCLDDKWDNEPSRSSVDKTRKETFWRGDHSSSVQARQSHLGSEWSIRLDVEMPR